MSIDNVLKQSSGGVAGMTPWGAAANAIGSAISTPNTSAANSGPITTGAHGFGGIQTGGVQGAAGAWMMPALIAGGVLVLVLLLRKGK